MARPKDPDSPYRVSEHHSNGHVYASSQPFVRDPKGNLVRRRTSWGVVIDSRFIPNKRFLYATQEEREKLIFPDHWDLSAKSATPISNGGLILAPPGHSAGYAQGRVSQTISTSRLHLGGYIT